MPSGVLPTAKEAGLDYDMEWIRYHDRYNQPADVAAAH